MRWYVLVPLIFDERVRLLLGFVVAAVVLAGVLTMVELRLRRKKEEHGKKTAEISLEDKLRNYINSDKSSREKLDFIDRTAKGYFREVYGIPSEEDYFSLIGRFKKMKRRMEEAFCRAMSNAYYSQKRLTKEDIKSLADAFISIRNKEREKESAKKTPSTMEKMDEFLAEWAAARAKQLRSWKERMSKKNNTKKLESLKIISESKGRAEDKEEKEVVGSSAGRDKLNRKRGAYSERAGKINLPSLKTESTKAEIPETNPKSFLSPKRVTKDRIIKRSNKKLESPREKEITLRDRRKKESERIEIARKKRFLEVYRKMKLAQEKKEKRIQNIIRKGVMELEDEENEAGLLYSGVIGS